MKNSDFFLGYFYALFKIFTQTNREVNASIGYNMSRMHLVTSLGKIQFAINRGICHVDGNYVLPAFQNYNNLFDTVDHWCDKRVWDRILYYFRDTPERFSYGEVRVTFQEMVEIIDSCGGIIFEETIQHNMNMFKTFFKDKSLKTAFTTFNNF